MEENTYAIIRYGYWIAMLPKLSFVSTKQLPQLQTKNYFAMEIL
jgi:hypothetical protein